MIRPVVLTIAGSDPSGGAGIQADLKTIAAFGLYGASVITALTAQDTTRVALIRQTGPEMLQAQLDAVLNDIPPQAVKIGMTGSSFAIRIITESLSAFPGIPVVTDPVMVSTSGRRLLPEDACKALAEQLFPRSSLITPNLPETETLLGLEAGSIATNEAMEEAALTLSRRYGAAVLLKGGHRQAGADDLLCWEGICTWFPGKRLANPNTHGTGCTLSSAIACGLAAGQSLEVSIHTAKDYVSRAIAAGLTLGQGNGPLWHGV